MTMNGAQRLRVAALGLALALGVGAPLTAQRATSTGVVAGTVRDDRGAPVSRVRVTLTLGRGVANAVSDESGRFVFASLGSGEYEIDAGKPGYIRLSAVDAPRLTRVVPGRQEITIALVRGATVTGTLRTEDGEPAVGNFVSLVAAESRSRRYQPIGEGGDVRSDGTYRIANVPPGRYLAQAFSWTNGEALRRASTGGIELCDAISYYGGGHARTRATVIELRPGDVRQDVSLSVGFVPVARLEVQASGAGDATPEVHLPRTQALSSLIDDLAKPVELGVGRFLFERVRPGTVVVTATATGADGTRLVAETEVTLEPGASEVVSVRLAPAVRLNISIRGVSSSGNAPETYFNFAQLVTDIDRGIKTPEIGFQSARLSPEDLTSGTYRLNFQHVPGWFVTAVSVDDVDVTDREFTLPPGDHSLTMSVTDAPPASVTGRLNGRTGPFDRVVLFAVDPTQRRAGSRRVRTALIGRDGQFSIEALPAGDYFVSVVRDNTGDPDLAPDMLERLARDARRVTLTHGQAGTMTVE